MDGVFFKKVNVKHFTRYALKSHKLYTYYHLKIPYLVATKRLKLAIRKMRTLNFKAL